jgi:hypothetical protein
MFPFFLEHLPIISVIEIPNKIESIYNKVRQSIVSVLSRTFMNFSIFFIR